MSFSVIVIFAFGIGLRCALAIFWNGFLDMALSKEEFDALPRAVAPISPTLEGERFNPLGIGYALSGGGYKAALFHLGGLMRMNELGWLKRVDRFSSVSGGSIAAALLATKWDKLDWQTDPTTKKTVGQAFYEEVARPLAAFCHTATLDWPNILAGMIPGVSAAERLVDAYDKHLFHGATLQQLSDIDAPRFVFNATNYELNSLWRISSAYAADYRIGKVMKPNFPLARVVAASSGFPPFFAPVEFDLRGLELDTAGATHFGSPFDRRALMADGGIYDNMGLEAVWKRFGVLLVSNAGDPFNEHNQPWDWFRKTIKITSHIHRQAENNRVRTLIDMVANSDRRRLAYWPGRSTVAQISRIDDLPALNNDSAAIAASEEVRLRPLSAERINRLVQHGYTLANAVAARWLGEAPAPTKLPSVI